MTYWRVTDIESGISRHVPAKLWYQARAAGLAELNVALGHPVSQDAVTVEEDPDHDPEMRPRTGALVGDRSKRP